MNLLIKNLCYLVILFVLVAVSANTAFAQGNSSANEEKTIEAQLRAFAEAYTNLPQSKNKANVLRYFSKEATSNIFVFNISGRSRVQNGDYKGFEAYLDNLLRTPGISLGYEIRDLLDIEVNGKVATLVYRVGYETKVPDGIWVKGNEIVTMALEKTGAEWKIVHYTIMQVEDEKLKGTCLCELFISEADDGEVVSKTTVPSGRSYNTRFDNFEFRTNGQEQMIKVQNKVYRRSAEGQLLYLDETENEEVTLGVSNSKKETVLMIIAESLYKDSCARLKTKSN